jgi:hypothetical protein
MATISPNKNWIALTGYDSSIPAGSNLAGSSSATINRVVGVFNTSTGTVDTSTRFSAAFNAQSPRSAHTVDGTNIYAVGGTSGVQHTTIGGSSPTQITASAVTAAPTNLRYVTSFAGDLYIAHGSGTTTTRVGKIAGLPTTTGQNYINFANFPTNLGTSGNPGGSPYSMFIADLSNSVAGADTIYVANDDNSTGTLSGIQKWTFNGTTWSMTGTVGSGANQIRGLTGFVSTTGEVTLIGSVTANALAQVTDTSGYGGTLSGSLSTFATAGTNTAFRGIVWVPEPTTLAAILSGLPLMLRRRSA